MQERLLRAFPYPFPDGLRAPVVTSQGSESLINVMLSWGYQVTWIAANTTRASDYPAPFFTEKWAEALKLRDVLAELPNMLDGENRSKAEAWLAEVDGAFVAATVIDEDNLNAHLGTGGDDDEWWRRRVPTQGVILRSIQDVARGDG